MIGEWLEQRREGVEQDESAIRGFIDAVVAGSITPAQIGAWLGFVVVRGMTDVETVHLTRAMTDSGARLQWPGLPAPALDKHSTGGVGDKVSLVLAPAWAALGRQVPMLSGRGLGITGGTLDKLEAIPGYRTDLQEPELRTVLQSVGCFISGQTAEIAPADRILYALRDETQTVPSVPLITASILSKKLAAGIEELVLDVKAGSGAFMQDRAAATRLAASLVAVGRGAGMDVRAEITDMDQPLGRAVGNAVEVEEAIQTLRGDGPADLVLLLERLSGDPSGIRRVLSDGSALERWQQMVRAMGGDPDARLRGGEDVEEAVVEAASSGELLRCDAGAVGRAAWILGAGRARAGEAVHHGVGILVEVKRGETVTAGQPLFRVRHAAGRGLEAALQHLADAVEIAS